MLNDNRGGFPVHRLYKGNMQKNPQCLKSECQGGHGMITFANNK